VRVKKKRAARRWRWPFVFLFLGGAVALGAGLLVIGLNRSTGPGTLLFCAGASFAAGSLGGFLFGIPKVLQGDREAPATGGDGGKPKDPKREYGQLVNTNLEQISDWLCKIIVGLGLYELRNIPDWLDNVGIAVAGDLAQPDLRSFAVAMLVYFVALGFISGYLLTRLFLAPEFARADLLSTQRIDEQFQRAKQRADETEKALLYTEALTMGLYAADGLYDPQAALEKLKKARESYPENRYLAIIEARVHERIGHRATAIKVLTDYLNMMMMAGKAKFPTGDRADVLYNRACYYSLESRDTAVAGQRPALIQNAMEDLRESIRLKSSNRDDARRDKDFHPIHQEPAFVADVGPLLVDKLGNPLPDPSTAGLPG
jgi:tetratricopeptide (TPR) repeat protein